MASLDINASIIEGHGGQIFAEWGENLDYFYKNAESIANLDVMGKIAGMDRTKLNFSLGSLGISGGELEGTLASKYGIFAELNVGDLVMCMTGLGNTKEHMKRLIGALSEISSERKQKRIADTAEFKKENFRAPKQAELFDIPRYKKSVPLAEAEGLICASSIIPYPPVIDPRYTEDHGTLRFGDALQNARLFIARIGIYGRLERLQHLGNSLDEL
jgi:lysine decarboxylase